MFKKIYRPDIDGIRAIAVIIVVFYHAKILGFNGGFVGVDVFFVLSGFLITQHLIAEVWEKGKISVTSFYSKRFRRLYPQLLFVILSILVIWSIFLLGFPEDTLKLYHSIQYSLFGLGNIYFKHKSGGYFETSSDQFPLLHMWSLSVEEQFYFVWPFLITLGFFNIKPNNQLKFQKQIIAILLALVSLSFFGSVYLIQKGFQPAAFYWMPARAWELGIGALLVFYVDDFENLIEKTKIMSKIFILEVMTLTGLLMILSSGMILAHKYPFPGVGAIFPTVGTALLILAGSTTYKTKTGCFYDNKLFIQIGLLSYGIYLWHWPFLAMLKVWNIGEESSLLLRWVVILGSVILAKFTLEFIEKPLRSGRFFSGKSHSLIILFFVSTSLVVISLVFAITKIEKKFYANEGNPLYKMIEERSRFREPCMNKLENIGSSKCTLQGTKNKNINVSVWGDSFGYAIFPMIEEFATEEGISATLYSNTSKAPFVFNPNLFYNGNQKETNEFRIANELVLKDIRTKLRNEPLVNRSIILSIYWNYYLGTKHIHLTANSVFVDRQKTYEGSLTIIGDSLEKTLTQLNGMGINRVLIILPYPEFRYHVLKCSQRNSKSCDTDRTVFDDNRKDVVKLVQKKTAKFSNVKLVDPAIYFCDNKKCPQIINVNNKLIPVVHDDTHPSSEAARFLETKIKNELHWLITKK